MTEEKINRFKKNKISIDSGMFEIVFGTLWMSMAVAKWVEQFINYYIFIGVLLALTLSLYYLIRIYFLKPREDIFVEQYLTNEKWQKIGKILFWIGIVIPGLFIIYFILGLASIVTCRLNYSPSYMCIDILNLNVLYLCFGSLILFPPFIMAYKTDTPRLILSGILYLLLPFLGDFLPEELADWATFILSILLVMIGMIALIRFIRKYPLPDKNAQPQSIEVEK